MEIVFPETYKRRNVLNVPLEEREWLCERCGPTLPCSANYGFGWELCRMLSDAHCGLCAVNLVTRRHIGPPPLAPED